MFVIQGGQRLSGTVQVSGAKNAALPIMAASLMISGDVQLDGIPQLVDVHTMAQLLSSMGSQVTVAGSRVNLVSGTTCHGVAPYDLVRRMRASICVLGPLLARWGAARVSLPGGCNIGVRPVDLHIRGLAALGAEVRLQHGDIIARAGRLRGAEVDLLGPQGTTVTGTCNILMAATLAQGRTVIRHAAREPEIADLARFLNRAGADIRGAGTDTIEIHGVETLRPVAHRVCPDRIEAVTLAAAAVISGDTVTIENTPVAEMSAVLEVMRTMGISLTATADTLVVRGGSSLRAVDLETAPWPGIPTDAQAQFMALLATASGTSRIRDTVFPDRFMHAAELNRMGANITVQQGRAVIRGVSRLSGSPVMASDLRASAALVIAALAAENRSEIRRVYHLDRGYERLEVRLNLLGAAIERRDDREGAAPIPAPHLPGPGRIARIQPAKTFHTPDADDA